MTTFQRRGFWRTSVNGNVHWVEAHEVDRDEWSRYVSPLGNPDLLRQVRAHIGATSHIVVPNAECPVCGAPVFFYRNEYGSKVFFDELGPPWPKHPCTISQTPESAGSREVALNAEDLRSQDEFEFIKNWSSQDSENEFERRYGTSRWDIAVLEKTHRIEGLTILAISTSKGYRYFLADDTSEVAMLPGQLIAFFRNWISYIEPKELKIVEFKLRRSGARSILNHIIGIEFLQNQPE